MTNEPHLYLLQEMEAEAVRWRRLAVFLFSVVLHAVMVIFALVAPQLFRRGAALIGINLERRPKPETTFLYMPPDLQRPKPPPKTNLLSDKNRIAQGKAPEIDPNALRMPYSRGNTPLPEIAGGAPPPAPPAPPGGGPQPKGAPEPPAPKPENPQLSLMDVPARPSGSEQSQLRLPASTPGAAIQQSLQGAARGRASGAVAGPGDSSSQFNNLRSNFSMDQPLVLSDTRGVDFGPYLARVVYNVRRNWYSVIPVSAQMGEKGRVAIVFQILKDGSVPQIRLVGSSGSDPLDTAALSAIKLSNPFPPLPEEFTGKDLVLQFFFLYNLGTGP
jgi:TonB family protein